MCILVPTYIIKGMWVYKKTKMKKGQACHIFFKICHCFLSMAIRKYLTTPQIENYTNVANANKRHHHMYGKGSLTLF